MATRTSNATGDFTVGATWVGGVAPTTGDLAIIANGHTVTIRAVDTVSVGDGNVTHYAISTAATGTGILIVETGATLTITSPCYQGNANWTIGRIVLTYTNASDGVWVIGDAHNNRTRLDILGETGTYGTLQSSSTGVLSFSGGGFLSAGLGSIRYYNVTKIGKSTVNLWTFNVTQSGDDITIRNCTFTNCGRIGNIFDGHGVSTIIVDDTTWTSTPGSCLGPAFAQTALSGGTRSIQGNYFDAPIGTIASGGQWKDFTIRYNFLNLFCQTDGDSAPATLGSNLFLVNSTALLIRGDTSVADPNFIHVYDSSGLLANPHVLALSDARNVTFDGWFIEPGNTDGSGDYILANSPGSARSHTVSHCIARLDSVLGGSGGMFSSCGGNANYAVSVFNNTYYSTADSGESGSCAYGETYEGHANIYAAIYNNLVVSNTGDGYVFIRRNERTFQDGAAAANIHHNGKYQLSAGGIGVAGYGDKATGGVFVAMFSTTVGLGSGDVTGNPNFVDDTRSIATWAVARGYSVSGTYSGRVTDAYAAIAVAPRTRIPDLITWCRAGFAPTNTAFRATGSGGVDIGAMAVVDAQVLHPMSLL